MLKIKDLNKNYSIKNKKITALKNINLNISKNSFITIVGKSGCGKTTLLRVISGLEKTSSGEIIFTSNINPALVFQEARLMPWLSVEENIYFPLKNKISPEIASEKVKEQLELLSLTAFKNAYPDQISGGMAQRTALGRALVSESELILMDEPLGSLDAFNRYKLQEDLKEIFLQNQSTVIFVTHDIDEAIFLGERILIMDAGEIIAEFKPKSEFNLQKSKEYFQLKEKILNIIKKGNKNEQKN